MNAESVLVGVLIEDTTLINFSDTCKKYNIPEALLKEMMEYGLFEHQSISTQTFQLTQYNKKRLESAFRLHQDLGINLPGVALALDLLDELEGIRQELRILKRHF